MYMYMYHFELPESFYSSNCAIVISTLCVHMLGSLYNIIVYMYMTLPTCTQVSGRSTDGRE